MDNRPKRGIKVQFGLGKLIIATNLIGIYVAIVIATEGKALNWAILLGFAAPIIVLIYLTIAWFCERKGWVRHVPLASKKRKRIEQTKTDLD